VLLGLRTVPGLDVGLASGVQDAPLTIPAGLAAGTWYVGVRADATGLAPESDEADNDLFALDALELSVPQLPDLRPTSLTFSPSVVNPELQQAVDFEESVENAGHVAAAQFRVGVYLATTPAISAADVLLHARQVVALDAGAASGAGASFQVPVGTPPGTYFVGVLVDDQGALDELSEGNNLLVAAGMLDVVDGGGGHAPNLVVEQVSTTASVVAAGGSFSVLTKVANVGDLSAAPFHVGVYLSDDDVVTTADTLVGERFQWNGLGVGFSSVVSGPVTVPAGLAPGTYHLGAIADHQSVVLESNELDNALVAGAQISVQ
jgi:subtilase family serine protease